MAANNSTVDGMGFEEVNQDSYTETISGTNIYGTTGSFITARATTVNSTNVNSTYVSGNVHEATVSTIQNLHVDVSVSGVKFRETGKGELYSTSIQNATALYGQRIRAGSVLIGDDSSGLIVFPSAGSFSTPNYFMTLTARDWTLPVASNTSGTGFAISGLRRASGCWAYGPSGTVADWIAVGI